MHISERTLLLPHRSEINRTDGLSLFFALICIVDVFGVFPIVTLPKAIIDCGFYGIFVVAIVCSTQIYTAVLLGKCWIIAEEIYPDMNGRNRYPYSALAEVTYGKCLSNLVTFLLDLTVFGGGIPNLIVASRTLQLLGLRISDQTLDLSYCYWIIFLGLILCPVLWLGSPKDMKCVCSISVFIVTSVFVLATSCLIFISDPRSTDPDNLGISEDDTHQWRSILTAYGIIAFQFDIHPTILTIQVDMNDKLKLPRAVFGAFGATVCMFGIVTILSYMKYGDAIGPSILETLPTTVLLDITAGLTALQLCLTSVIGNNVLYQHMEDCLNISRDFSPRRCVLRTILMILAIVMAQSVPSFDLVMSTIGGTLTGPLVFILPALFYLKMLSLKTNYKRELSMESLTNILPVNEDSNLKCMSRYREEDFSSLTLVRTYPEQVFSECFEKFLCLTIIAVCTFATIITTYFNFSNAILSYNNYTKPCIYNISSNLLYL